MYEETAKTEIYNSYLLCLHIFLNIQYEEMTFSDGIGLGYYRWDSYLGKSVSDVYVGPSSYSMKSRKIGCKLPTNGISFFLTYYIKPAMPLTTSHRLNG